MLPTLPVHRPVVAPRLVASLYCTITLTQIGLGLGVMSVGLLAFALDCLTQFTAPLLCCFGFLYGFEFFFFCFGWYMAEVFLLLPPHLFDLFLYWCFG